ncbi:acyltransferase [Micrococcales bacterium 31B]|nr:acyltransferase [Micrococcales bacterium 31B]
MTAKLTSAPRAGGRTDCFDFLRLWAAASVVLVHTVVHLKGEFFFIQGSWIYFKFDGVAMFFIMSGLMIFGSATTWAQKKRPWWAFYANRGLRIIPAIYTYLLTAVAVLAVLGFITWGTLQHSTFWRWVVQNLTLTNVYAPPEFHGFGVGNPNGSLWTIPVEVSFYLVVPLLALAALRNWAVTNTVVWVVALAALVTSLVPGWASTMFGPLQPFVTFSFLPYLYLFWLGANLRRYWRPWMVNWWACAGAVVLHFALWFWRLGEVGTSAGLKAALQAVPLAYIIMCVGTAGPAFLHRFTQRLGDLSFGIYIWHMLIVNVLIHVGLRDSTLNGTLKVCIGLAISAAVAYVSWHVIEKPALRRKPMTSRDSDAATPSP